MSSLDRIARVAALLAAVAAWPVLWATAQEITASELAAARSVARSAPQLGDFNNILPRLATTTKDRLIRVRPELFQQIGSAVDTMALELAPRRTELDTDFARAWARHFTEEELVAINGFFGSEVGMKYKETAPIVGRELIQASGNWTNRVGDELYEKSIAELRRQGFDF